MHQRREENAKLPFVCQKIEAWDLFSQQWHHHDLITHKTERKVTQPFRHLSRNLRVHMSIFRVRPSTMASKRALKATVFGLVLLLCSQMCANGCGGCTCEDLSSKFGVHVCNWPGSDVDVEEITWHPRFYIQKHMVIERPQVLASG